MPLSIVCLAALSWALHCRAMNVGPHERMAPPHLKNAPQLAVTDNMACWALPLEHLRSAVTQRLRKTCVRYPHQRQRRNAPSRLDQSPKAAADSRRKGTPFVASSFHPSSAMQQLLSSHALNDLSAEIIFDSDPDLSSLKQLAGSDGLSADAVVASAAAAGLKPAPPRGPKPYADIPLPPPDKPLKWKTKLVRILQLFCAPCWPHSIYSSCTTVLLTWRDCDLCVASNAWCQDSAANRTS